MVSYKDVLKHLSTLKSASPGTVAVFVGATNGIGQAALRSFVAKADSPTVYIVGRDISRLNTFISELRSTNPTAKLHPIITKDLTLIGDAQKAAEEIASREKKVDLLIMSPGYLSTVRDESPEGLDRRTVLAYQARMRFLVTLAPLLRSAKSPRAVSVLGGGWEAEIWADDFRLEKDYSMFKSMGSTASMNTLFLEEFARQPENNKMSFVHLYPGVVKGTGIEIKGLGPWWKTFVSWVVVPIMTIIGYTAQESGDRVLYAATHPQYNRNESDGGKVDKQVSSGLYLVHQDSSILGASKILKQMESEGMAKKLYDHTMEEFAQVARQST